MTRDELIEVVREAGEIVEQALPVGNSVVKDQLMVMIAMELMHEKSPPPRFPYSFAQMARDMMDDRPIALGLTELAKNKSKEKVWETFVYFMRQLSLVKRATPEEIEQAFKDERSKV